MGTSTSSARTPRRVWMIESISPEATAHSETSMAKMKEGREGGRWMYSPEATTSTEPRDNSARAVRS